jgi:hypothetical protein
MVEIAATENFIFDNNEQKEGERGGKRGKEAIIEGSKLYVLKYENDTEPLKTECVSVVSVMYFDCQLLPHLNVIGAPSNSMRVYFAA